MISNRGKLTGLKRSPYGEEKYDSDLEKYYMVELEGMPGVKSWTKKHNIKIPYNILFITRTFPLERLKLTHLFFPSESSEFGRPMGLL